MVAHMDQNPTPEQQQALTEARADIADLGQKRARQPGKSRTEGKGHHVHPARWNADARGHVPVLHHRAYEQPQRRLRQQQPRPQHDERGEKNDENPIVPQAQIADVEVAEQPGRGIDLHIVGTKHHSETLLHDK